MKLCPLCLLPASPARPHAREQPPLAALYTLPAHLRGSVLCHAEQQRLPPTAALATAAVRQEQLPPRTTVDGKCKGLGHARAQALQCAADGWRRARPANQRNLRGAGEGSQHSRHAVPCQAESGARRQSQWHSLHSRPSMAQPEHTRRRRRPARADLRGAGADRASQVWRGNAEHVRGLQAPNSPGGWVIEHPYVAWRRGAASCHEAWRAALQGCTCHQSGPSVAGPGPAHASKIHAALARSPAA